MKRVGCIAFSFFAAASIAAMGPAFSAQPGGRTRGDPRHPAPVLDDTIALDTHFGMDAETGEIRKYTGNVHPDEIGMDGAPVGEQVLYVSPPIDVENRYVPPAGVAAGAPPPEYSAPRPRIPQASQSPQTSQPSEPPQAPRKSSWNPLRRILPQRKASAPSPAVDYASAQPSRPSDTAAKQRPDSAPKDSADKPARQAKERKGKKPWWRAVWRK